MAENEALARPSLPPISASVRNYVLFVGICGPLAALTVAALLHPSVPRHMAVAVALLWALAALGDRFPLHLTHKTTANIGTVAIVAIVVVLPPGLAGILAWTAASASQLSRYPKRRDAMEALF